MTQEEKELLLKDLSARLPYGVKVTDGLHIIELKVRIDTTPATLAQFINSNNLKYYLRPMSSMTEDEMKEWEKQLPNDNWHIGDSIIFDWLNAHHFGYRGLIEKGLALEAPVDMYKTKQ